MREQARVPELAVGHVHRDVGDRGTPRGELPADLVDDPVAERDDQAGLGHRRQELAREQETAFRVAPAHERFEPVGAAADEVDDRLVVHLELLLVQGAADVCIQVQLVYGVGVH